MRRIVLYFILLGILSLSACAAKEQRSKLTVLSSIKPVQAMVSAIAGEHVLTHQLIPDFASPHNYTFKPSDMRQIESADVIFRIDEHFEVVLNSAFEDLKNHSKVISLAENPAIRLLRTTEEHKHSEHDEEHSEEQHETADMHIFTSPKNAMVMAKVIADTLSNLEPKNAESYQRNLQRFKDKVTKVSNKIRLELEPVKNKPYVVFHNSWQYFGRYFGLQSPTVVDFQENVTAGGRTVKNIRNEIISKNIRCIFKEPSTPQSRVNVLTENLSDDISSKQNGNGIKNVEIDVLGRNIQINQDSYVTWLSYMGEQVKQCLEE